MFQKDKWPFTPVCLNEIIDKDTLAVIESGCCERLGRPLTIFDYDPQTGGFSHRIESIDEKQRYEEFCRFLRGDEVIGGDAACKQEDIIQAERSLQRFRETGDPFRVFECHMGLMETTYVIQLRDRPVALVFCGQYRPSGKTETYRRRVRALGTTPHSDIRLGDAERDQLLALSQETLPMPANARQALGREVRHIQRIAQAEFERHKRQWEQDFLDELRGTSIGPGEVDRRHLERELSHKLGLITSFCRCDYAVFYGSRQEGDTVLAPIAKIGISSEISGSLPHFNWKKARLPVSDFHLEKWNLARWLPKARERGIRGDNSEFFAEAACIIPMSLNDRYRGVLVLGPFAEPVDLELERRFLMEMANTVGLFALSGLEVLYLEQERRRWRSTATLLTHQLRTALTPIAILIGRTKNLVRKSGGEVDVRRVYDFLSQAEDLALHLSQGAKETLSGHVLQVEPEDLEFERASLSALVANCAAGFKERAQERNLKLIVDSHVESLPDADVDVARLTIALANLIDNAVKYSFSGRTIYIRSHVDSILNPDQASAIIEVDNLGYGIPPEERDRIFEQGTRGLTRAKLGHIPGSGLGLWEARAVVAAHGGQIDMRCDETSIRRYGSQAHHVVFSMKIPLRQNKRR